MSKHTNLELRLENTLLMMILTSSSDPVGVPTLPGYTTLLPKIVIHVRLGYNFWGSTSHTTFLNESYLRRATGIFSRLITQKVSEPETCCLLGTYFPFPTPWRRCPS